MMMNDLVILDYRSSEPIFMQIVSQIEKYVALGVLKTNDTLPSIRRMATSLGINPNTVKKAYEELEKRGVISTMSTKNSVILVDASIVKQMKIDEGIVSLRKQIDELVNLGISKEDILKKL